MVKQTGSDRGQLMKMTKLILLTIMAVGLLVTTGCHHFGHHGGHGYHHGHFGPPAHHGYYGYYGHH
jgi:hypothetical protein